MMDNDATVAIIDDDPSVRRGLERLLRSAGYRVETFASAREFLQRGDSRRAGCIVLDVRMPGQTGPDLHETLLADDYPIPVIFISGHGDAPLAMRALKAGAVDFLTKPLEDATLLTAVERAIARNDLRPLP